MKIAFISKLCFIDSIGGVENHLKYLTLSHMKLGHDVVCFQPTESVSETTMVIFEGIKVIQVPYKNPKIISLLQNYSGNKVFKYLIGFLNKASANLGANELIKQVDSFSPDYIHQHDFISSLFATKKLSKKYPVFFTNHTGEYLLLRRYFLGRLFLRFALNHYTAIVGPSIELTPVEYSKNTITIHNGADFSVFKNLEESVIKKTRKDMGFSADDIIVLCPRRWAPTKGVIYLAKAIQQFDFDKRIKFLFAGSDYTDYIQYRNEVEAILLPSVINKKVILLGNLNSKELNVYYNLSSIVVIPSLMEAVSLSAVEAMATNNVVISTNVGGMPELIKNNYNGILIPPESPKALYQSIQKLTESDCFYEEIRKNSSVNISEYSWDDICSRTYNFFKKFII